VQSGRVRDVRVGIGVNLTYAPEISQAPGTLAAGRLAEADGVFATPDAWALLFPALTRRLAHGRDAVAGGNGAVLVDRYRDRAAFLGRHVTIWPVDDDGDARLQGPTPIAQGRVLELRPDLSLILDGLAEPVRTGRMTIDP
jgi:biotin-(acetyl-CoA carboxylase) ligase